MRPMANLFAELFADAIQNCAFTGKSSGICAESFQFVEPWTRMMLGLSSGHQKIVCPVVVHFEVTSAANFHNLYGV